MVRLEGWELRLSRFLAGRRKVPFSWDQNNCLFFAADAVKEITGIDPAEEFRGITNKEEADKAIADNGGVAGLITKTLGVAGHRDLLLAKRGDIVTLKLNGGLTAGVVDDSGVQVAVPLTDQDTLLRFPLKSAWRVWSY